MQQPLDELDDDLYGTSPGEIRSYLYGPVSRLRWEELLERDLVLAHSDRKLMQLGVIQAPWLGRVRERAQRNIRAIQRELEIIHHPGMRQNLVQLQNAWIQVVYWYLRKNSYLTPDRPVH